jgi:hypothetical protein
MNADGTLTPGEQVSTFGQGPQGRKFTGIEGLDPETELHEGDFIRVLAYNSPTWLDSLFNSAQTNAEEHTDQVVQVFLDHGIVVTAITVQGVTIADNDVDHREAYCYDLEIYGFTTPPAQAPMQANFVGAVWALAALVAAIGFTTVAIKIATIEPNVLTDTAKRISSDTSSTAMWLAIGAVAIAAAVIFWKAKGTSSG